MSMEQLKLGAFVKEVIDIINNNFSDVQLNKAGKEEIPTKLSELTNDSGFQNESQVRALISALVDSAPETLDTLKELATALGNDPNFATTIATQLGSKVDKVEGKQLSTNDYTTEEKNKLAGLKNYTLPVAGEALGGIKNGGNVVVSPDGTANVSLPESGSGAVKMDFTTASAWAQDESIAAGYWFIKLNIASQKQKTPLSVFRKNNTRYEQAVAMVFVDGDNVVVGSSNKFDGYVVVV